MGIPKLNTKKKEEVKTSLPKLEPMGKPETQSPAAPIGGHPWAVGQTLPKPSFGERVKNVFTGTAKGSASNYGNAMTTLFQAGQGMRDTQNREYRTTRRDRLDRAERDLRIMMEDNRKNPGTWGAEEIRSQQNIINEEKRKVGAAQQIPKIQRKATAQAQQAMDQLSTSSTGDIERAKEGLGKLGQFAVDVGAAGLGMVGDAAVSAATGLPMLLPMAGRSFGGGAQEARLAGGDLQDQLLYGAGSALVSVATEKISNATKPFAKMFGKGATDDLVEAAIGKAVEKAAKTAGGKAALEAVLKTGAGFAGEGLEEFLEDVASPILKRMTFDPQATFDLQEAAYDFLVGGALGGLGGGVEAATNLPKVFRQNQQQEQTEQRNRQIDQAYDTMREKGMFTVEGQSDLRKAQGKPQLQIPKVRPRPQTADSIIEEFRRENPREEAPVQPDAQLTVAEKIQRGIQPTGGEIKSLNLADPQTRQMLTRAGVEVPDFASLGVMKEKIREAVTRNQQNPITESVRPDMRAVQDQNREQVDAIVREFGTPRPLQTEERPGYTWKEGGWQRDESGWNYRAPYAEREDQRTAESVPVDSKEGRGTFPNLNRFMDQQNGQELEMPKLRKAEQGPTATVAKNATTPQISRESGLDLNDQYVRQTLDRESAQKLDTVARALGVRVSFVDKVRPQMKDGQLVGTANAQIRGSEVQVEKGNPNPVRFLLGHEWTHRMQELAKPEYEEFRAYVESRVADQVDQKLEDYRRNDVELTREEALDEAVADYAGQMIEDGKVLDEFINQNRDNRSLLQKALDAIREMARKLTGKEREQADQAEQKLLNALNASAEAVANERNAARETARNAQVTEQNAREAMQREDFDPFAAPDSMPEFKARYSVKKTEKRIEESKPISGDNEVKYSLKNDSKYMDAAEQMNERSKKNHVKASVMKQAREARQAVADIFNDPELAESLGLPEDIIANTYIPNGSYSGTEENTTVCIRSMGADALMDAVAEHLGRPLTVEDTVAISQEYWKYTDKPECLYCYVAMDRKAYREFLGSYLQQRDDAIRNLRNGMSETDAYKKFLDGRKDTKNMKRRFGIWAKLAKTGGNMIKPADLASTAAMEKAIARNPALKEQINDARKYAQSASWAKKRIGYAAYNNHILKWKDDRIRKLNSNYGLRMYSFSDFSPAFILENMQMVTDAAVRGLKVLAYTKEIDFAKIFAPTGMNINISVFGYGNKNMGVTQDGNGMVAMDAMQGADWAEAKAMREKYPNVGVTFVATNDDQVEWALAQDWVDVVIPFHLVRTGSKVASYFGWKNYTAMSADIKAEGHDSKKDAKSILPPQHQNNKEMYLEACRKNHLTPRFADWVNNPNYMKLVNETRRSEAETPTVQPVFDVEAAKDSIETMRKRGGYYKPIGGSEEVMQDIAGEISDKITGKTRFSLKEETAQTGKPYVATLYHGSGKTAGEIYAGVQYPVAGRGTYYAMTEKDAKNYGDRIETAEVELKRPLVIRDDQEWLRLTKAAGWKYANPAFQSKEDTVKAAEALKAHIIRSGYDGLVIQYDAAREGDINRQTKNAVRTLDKVFGHDQVVAYQTKLEKPTVQPRKTIIDKPKPPRETRVEKAVETVDDGITEENDKDGYWEALSKEENFLDPYTPADAVYDARMRDLEKREAPPEEPKTSRVEKRDLDELVELYKDIANPVEPARDARMEESENLVSSKSEPEPEKSRREQLEDARSYAVRKMIDAGDSVARIGKKIHDEYLYPFYNMARGSASAGINMITDEQTNITGDHVGKSLNAVFDPIRAKGDDYYREFQLYMLDLHNADRMSLHSGTNEAQIKAEMALRQFDAEHPDIATMTEARLERKTKSIDLEEANLAKERLRLKRDIDRADELGNKPVFGYEMTADMSQERARKLLSQHPEFAEYEKDVRTYIDNMMQYRVDSGLITQEDADFLKKYYPHYVPVFRKMEKDPEARNQKRVQVGKTVGRAKGGNQRIMPLHEAMGKQTMMVTREGSKNRFGQRLLADYESNKAGLSKYIQKAEEYEGSFSPEGFDSAPNWLSTRNSFVIFRNGKRYEMIVDDSLFDGVKALYPETKEVNKWTRGIRAANNLFKALVTGYNPMFVIRNPVRDVQDAGLYTRDAKAFAKNYPKALKEIKNNGAYWQKYKALGGSFSSVFDYQTGTVKEAKGGKLSDLAAKIEAVNMAMEQTPRLAEFMSIVQKGDGSMENLMDAMHAAADVTTNFGRSGTLGKVLNANFIPFYNPGVQGFDRMVRRISEAHSTKEWRKLIVRAAMVGVAPAVINGLLYAGDDDWDDIKDREKDTNYLFKIGDGLWLKIPKGRVVSAIGAVTNRAGDVLSGKKPDIGGTVKTIASQVAPPNPLKQNIAVSFIEADLFDPKSPGKTWYGGDIEPRRLQAYRPSERYDGSTDVLSKFIGKVTGLSPKKINYVLDSYTGVVGDFVLPLLTPQAERDPFTKAFTLDSVRSSRISEDFYRQGDEITYDKSSGDPVAKVLGRFWEKQNRASSDIQKQIREIETSDKRDSEKKKETREAKAVMNGIQKNALEVLPAYQKAVEKYLKGDSDEAIDKAYREANREVFGAEYALEMYNKDTYAKAQDAKANGVSMDTFYQYYFDTNDYEKRGDKSVRTQKMEYLQRSRIPEKQKAEIYYADLADDGTLLKQAELERSAGITSVEYYQYKMATAGLHKKDEKLAAINRLNISSAKKTALYYSNGWAKSTFKEAPWAGGISAPTLGKPKPGGKLQLPKLR